MTSDMSKADVSLLLLAQTLDALTFVLFFTLVPAGYVGAFERNPVVVAIVTFGGLGLLAAFKVGLSAFVYVMRREEAPTWLRIAVLAATVSGFIGCASNVLATVQLMHALTGARL
jgi:hypothetical protein